MKSFIYQNSEGESAEKHDEDAADVDDSECVGHRLLEPVQPIEIYRERERERESMIKKSQNTFSVDAKLGHFRKGQKIFQLIKQFSYSADVKPTVNKNRFKYI